MAEDIDPTALDEQQIRTPHLNSLPRMTADLKRITEQQMRANPMVNAVVDRGLTRWRGNYGGDLVWIGEFNPGDPNKGVPQRGVSIVRDDPKRQSAFAMFDPNPQAGIDLRQQVSMHDADGRALLREGNTGGVAFPRGNVPVVGNGVQNITSSGTVAYGRFSLVGRHLDWLMYIRIFNLWPVTGAPGFGNVNVPLETAAADSTARVTFNVSVQAGSHTISSANQTVGAASAFPQGILDLSDAFDDDVEYAIVNVNAWVSAGPSGRVGFSITPAQFHNYTRN